MTQYGVSRRSVQLLSPYFILCNVDEDVSNDQYERDVLHFLYISIARQNYFLLIKGKIQILVIYLTNGYVFSELFHIQKPNHLLKKLLKFKFCLKLNGNNFASQEIFSQNEEKSLKGCYSLFWALYIFEKIVFALYNFFMFFSGFHVF